MARKGKCGLCSPWPCETLANQVVRKSQKSTKPFPANRVSSARHQLLAKFTSGEQTMLAKKWFTYGAFGFVLSGALALGTQAQTPDPTPQQQDIHQDKKDIRQDKRDLAKDRADRNADQRDINHDKADLAKDRADRNADQRDINHDKADLSKDRADRNQDQRDINHDKNQLARDDQK